MENLEAIKKKCVINGCKNLCYDNENYCNYHLERFKKFTKNLQYILLASMLALFLLLLSI